MPWLLLYFSEETLICSLLVCTLNPIEHSPSGSLQFNFAPLLISWVKNFISFFSLSLFFPLPQPGLYSLLLLFCFLHLLIIIFLYCRHPIFIFHFAAIFLFLFNLYKTSFRCCCCLPCCGFSATLLLLVKYLFNFTSDLRVYPSLFLPHYSHCLSCFTYVVHFALSICLPQFYPILSISSVLPLNNIFPSFSYHIFPVSYCIISIISFHLY